jgi:hypothetical protein
MSTARIHTGFKASFFNTICLVLPFATRRETALADDPSYDRYSFYAPAWRAHTCECTHAANVCIQQD